MWIVIPQDQVGYPPQPRSAHLGPAQNIFSCPQTTPFPKSPARCMWSWGWGRSERPLRPPWWCGHFTVSRHSIMEWYNGSRSSYDIVVAHHLQVRRWRTYLRRRHGCRQRLESSGVWDTEAGGVSAPHQSWPRMHRTRLTTTGLFAGFSPLEGSVRCPRFCRCQGSREFPCRLLCGFRSPKVPPVRPHRSTHRGPLHRNWGKMGLMVLMKKCTWSPWYRWFSSQLHTPPLWPHGTWQWVYLVLNLETFIRTHRQCHDCEPVLEVSNVLSIVVVAPGVGEKGTDQGEEMQHRHCPQRSGSCCQRWVFG